MSEERLRSGTGRAFGGAFVCALVAAINLAFFLRHRATIAFGAFAGGAAGLGWVATGLATTFLFERRPTRLILIDAGYHVVSLTVMGVILGPGVEGRRGRGMLRSACMPRIAVFSAKRYDRAFLDAANADFGFSITYFEAHLDESTAALAHGFDVVCGFVHDRFSAPVLDRLAAGGIRVAALRCAGFNNVDLVAAAARGVTVVRVPAYSPHSVAEHTVGLILNLDRKIHRAWNRVREGNFALDGLLGGELYQRKVGIVGTGRIGAVVARILGGFQAEVLAYDPSPSDEVRGLGARYVPLDELLAASQIVTLHCPLTPANRHMIDGARLARMQRGALLVNTSRGGLVDTPAVIAALKKGWLGGLAIDVYEEEEALFFEDRSGEILDDDVFARLLTFPNVLITGHQAFFTERALRSIARTTLENVACVARGEPCANAVRAG